MPPAARTSAVWVWTILVACMVSTLCSLSTRTQTLARLTMSIGPRSPLAITMGSLVVCILSGCQTAGGPVILPVPLFTGIHRSTGPANAAAYNVRGIQRLQAGNTYGALEDFREAVKREPDNATFQENFGWLLVNFKDYQSALASLNTAVALNGNNADALWKRGVTRRLLEDYTVAIEDYTQALIIDPSSIPARSNRAVARTNLGQWAEAHEDYTKVIEQKPTAGFYSDRALVRTVLGDILGAAVDFSHAIDLSPRTPLIVGIEHR